MNEFDVILSPSEQVIARYIAEQRYQNKRSGGVEDKRYANFDLDLHGFGAEMAFCKWENAYPDFLIHNKAGGWDGKDKFGRRVDVKWSSTDYLLAPKHKMRGHCDVFVLVKGKFPQFTMIGWATEEELIDQENLKDWFNKGVGYGIHRDNLRTMWSNVQ